MPTTPKYAPNMVMEKITQKLDNPVDSPSILGPRILPSKACNKIMRIKNLMPLNGLINNINKILGIAPIKGPKNGITLVIPIITLIKIG